MPDAARFLLAQRHGKGWRTTIESAWAILGLASILDRSADYATPGRLTIAVDGAGTSDIVLPGGVDPKFDGRVSVPVPDGERVVLRLSFDGKGMAFYTAALECLVRDGEPVSRGLTVEREYYEKDGDAWRPVGGRARASRALLVHLAVTTPEAREYVMIVDPRGDGFEPLDARVEPKGKRRISESFSDVVDVSDGWPARVDEYRRTRDPEWGRALLREIIEKRRFRPQTRDEELALPAAAPHASVEHRDDRTIFFLAALPAGTSHLYYLVRPEFEGEFRILPPRAEPMYEPEIWGSGAESRIAVGGVAAAPLPLAPGVEGLLPIIAQMRAVDADELIALVPSNPRIGDLLARVAVEAAFRAWLGVDSGPGIAAARRDVATRRLCVGAPLAAIEEALASDRAFQRGLEGAPAATDEALAWAMEDRAMRLELLAQAQKLRGTSRVDDLPFRPVTVARVQAALKPRDPVAWKLLQRASFPAGSVIELASRLERELALSVRALRDGPAPAAAGTVAEVLDAACAPAKLAWRVRDGGIVIGTLDEIAP